MNTSCTRPARRDRLRTEVRFGRAFVAGALLLAWSAGGDAAAHDDAPVVKTTLGAVRGVRVGGAERFLGVPYARPPVGDLRFRNPVPAARWKGILEATTERLACSQLPSADSAVKVVNEDCLYVNIYRPAGARDTRLRGQKRERRLPVLFHIHGGGLFAGTANNHDGSKIAITNQMVVVMVEYRLNAFGFLATPELSAEAKAAGGRESSGNYGLMDQQLALQWVQDNVAAFGGDPDNVTISGQSAGGWSVCDHLTAPASAPLFHRAIILSGDCTAQPLAAAETSGATFAATRLGCADSATRIACLRGKPAQAILDATAGNNSGFSARVNYGPDGDLFTVPPAEAIAAGDFHKVPVMLGATRDEVGFVALFGPGAQVVDQSTFEAFVDTQPAWADLAPAIKAAYQIADYPVPAAAAVAAWADSGIPIHIGGCVQRQLTRAFAAHTRTFWYEFNDRTMPIQLNLATNAPNITLPPGVTVAYHAGDLKYTVGFDTVAELNDQQLALSNEIIQYWGAFARTGRPNIRGQASWAPYAIGAQGAVMSFDLPRSVAMTDGQYAAEHHCEVWDGE